MIKYKSRKTMLSFSYHKVEKGVAMIVKVALRNGYNVYGRVVEENSSSIRLVAQRELIPEMRIAHIRCSKDIGETIVIDRSQVVETEEVSYDEMEFVGEPETKWSFWLGFSEHLSEMTSLSRKLRNMMKDRYKILSKKRLQIRYLKIQRKKT